jgi:hypothetical protein
MNQFLAQVFDIWKNTGSGGATCNIKGPCTLCDAVVVTSNIITYLVEIAIPLAVIMIVYGGLRMALAGGNENTFKESRGILTSAVVGLMIAIASWLLVDTLLHVLAGSNSLLPWDQINCSG